MKKFYLALATLAISFTGFNQIQGYNVGDTVADFTVTDTDGNTHTLSDYTNAGKWVVLDFFLVECAPCQQTAPTFNELHEKYGCNEGDLVCLTINNGYDNDAEVIQFENTYGGSFSHSPAVSNEGGGASVDSDFSPGAYPTYCLIGSDMKLKSTDIWPIMSVASFESVFASNGFSPTEMACQTSSVNEITLTSLILYPNPSNGNFTIDVNAPSNENLTIEVINTLGQLVYTQDEEIHEGNNSINIALENVMNGNYIVKLTTESGVITRNVQVSNK